MLNSETLAQLRAFRMPGFIAALIEQDERMPTYQGLSFEERLTLLIQSEHARRTSERITRKIREASLITHATIDQIDYEVSRGLSRTQFLELAGGAWINASHHLIITGPTGVGKTFIASALAHNACRRGMGAKYLRINEWLGEFAAARATGTLKKLRAKLASLDLLIIDEWLREPLSLAHARELLDLFDDRYRKGSCIVISQLPVTEWHKQIADPTIADAILDRLVHDALRIDLKGESMRKLTSTLKNPSPPLTSVQLLQGA